MVTAAAQYCGAATSIQAAVKGCINLWQCVDGLAGSVGGSVFAHHRCLCTDSACGSNLCSADELTDPCPAGSSAVCTGCCNMHPENVERLCIAILIVVRCEAAAAASSAEVASGSQRPAECVSLAPVVVQAAKSAQETCGLKPGHSQDHNGPPSTMNDNSLEDLAPFKKSCKALKMQMSADHVE